MPRAPFLRLLAAACAGVVAAGVLSACGAEQPPSAQEPRGLTEPAASSAAPTQPQSAPTAAPTAKDRRSRPPARSRDKGGKQDLGSVPVARADGLRLRLLAAGDLPATGEQGWAERRTRGEGTRRVGACQRTPMVDIGALKAVVRTYDGPGETGWRARQVVARFADRKSAWRAHQVIRAWRDDCTEVLDDPAEVGPMREVDLDAGHGSRYRAEHGSAKKPRHLGLAVWRQGRWFSLVSITARGSEDFPSSWTRDVVRRLAHP